MSVASNQVSVTSGAGGTQIVPPASSTWPVTKREGGPTRCVVITNGSGAIVYLGASGLTTSTGLVLGTSATVTLWLYAEETVYGIVASTSSTVSYLESGS